MHIHPTIKAYASIRNPKGFYALPHLLIIALAILIAFLAGVGTGVTLNGKYFAQKYRAPLHVITHPAHVVSAPSTAPAAASIRISYYPAVGDQGPIGACAGWAAAWAMTYEYRISHASWLRFSPRYLYDQYVDRYNGGADAGSNFGTNVRFGAEFGAPRFKQFPYPPYTVEDPVPLYDVSGGSLQADALRYRLAWSSQTLESGQGGGQAAVNAGRDQIASGNPFGVALPVYSQFDNATQQPLIVSPSPQQVQQKPGGRGGHEIVALAYNDAKLFPDGTVGGFLVQNQWSAAWGSNGRAWLSYDFVRRFVFELASVRLGTTTASRLGPADGGARPHAPLVKVPRPTNGPTPITAGGWYVKTFDTRDTGRNIAPLINAAGDRTGIWPVYILAVVFAESGGNQYSARWGVWPDVSFGLMQVTTSTLTGYYGGCGFDSYCAQRYLNDAATSINLGADILRDYKARSGVGYPGLWQCYNAGVGSCQSPYYAGFLQNYYVALTYATTSPGPLPPPPPPKPKPAHRAFPGRRWCRYSRSHGTHCPTHRWHKRDTDIAKSWRYFLDHAAGGAVTRERWNPKLGLEREVFRHYLAYSWPRYPRIVKWVKRRG